MAAINYDTTAATYSYTLRNAAASDNNYKYILYDPQGGTGDYLISEYGNNNKIIKDTRGYNSLYYPTSTASNLENNYIIRDYNATTSSITWDYGDNYTYQAPPVKPEDRLREIIRTRQCPVFVGSRWRPVAIDITAAEARARATLRRIVGEDKFRQFLKRGFVTLRSPKTGLVYQIFPGHRQTAVWKDGNAVEELCVVLPHKYPPTDALLIRYLLILNDEKDFRNRCNKWAARRGSELTANIPSADRTLPLPELFKQLRHVA